MRKRARATVARVTAKATRVAGDAEGKCDGGNSDGNGNEGERRRQLAMATTWAMVTATRVTAKEGYRCC